MLLMDHAIDFFKCMIWDKLKGRFRAFGPLVASFKKNKTWVLAK